MNNAAMKKTHRQYWKMYLSKVMLNRDRTFFCRIERICVDAYTSSFFLLRRRKYRPSVPELYSSARRPRSRKWILSCMICLFFYVYRRTLTPTPIAVPSVETTSLLLLSNRWLQYSTKIMPWRKLREARSYCAVRIRKGAQEVKLWC